MSQLYGVDFTESTSVESGAEARSLVLMATGTFGGGTLSVQMWSNDRQAYRSVAVFTEAMTSAQEIVLGKGQRFRFTLAGAASPNIEVDYWFI